MKIISSQLRYASSNQSQSLTQRVGSALSRGRPPSAASPGSAVTMSSESRLRLESSRYSHQHASSKVSGPTGTVAQHTHAEQTQHGLRLTVSTSTSDRISLSAGAARGIGTQAHTYSRQQESENTQYQLTGQIALEDGRQVDFAVTGHMSRSLLIEEASGIHIEKLPQKDPLILNFAASTAQLTDTAFSFDIDGDGNKEKISFATGGSGFVFLDRNGNGELDDGSELFGARTGKGFAELAEHDEDGNGFIDSGDAIYQQLRVISRNEAGEDTVKALDQLGIGALGLQAARTEFEITDDYQQSRGRLRATGVAVSDDGRVMTLQQVDLTQRSLRNEADFRARFEAPRAPDRDLDENTIASAVNTESAIADALQRLQAMTQEMQQRLQENAEPQQNEAPTSLLALLVERFLNENKTKEDDKTAGTATRHPE